MVKLRAQRIAEQMKKEIASIIKSEIKDPRLGFVTVTSVELSNDLRHSKVYISVYGNDAKKEDSLNILKKATGFVRKELSRRIKLRYTPEIVFKIDNSIEHGVKIAKLLSKVKDDSSCN